MKRAILNLNSEKPAEILETEDDAPIIDEEKSTLVRKVCETVAAYLTASEKLVETKYPHLKLYTPTYLMAPGVVVVLCSSDGVAIRYETRIDKRSINGAWNEETLAQGVKALSQNVIRLVEPGQSRECLTTDGIDLTLYSRAPFITAAV